MKLGDLLDMKESRYRITVTIGAHETISAAIQKLAEHDRGILPVCDNKGNLIGIVSERDIVRKCCTQPQACARSKVQDIMSKDVVVGNLEDDLSYAINVMRQKRIRHLPIVDNQRVIGMISMRDLLGVQLEECEIKVKYLNDYISGGYR